MDTLIDTLVWLALTAAMTTLAWLYGASWKVAADALTGAAERAAQDVVDRQSLEMTRAVR